MHVDSRYQDIGIIMQLVSRVIGPTHVHSDAIIVVNTCSLIMLSVVRMLFVRLLLQMWTNGNPGHLWFIPHSDPCTLNLYLHITMYIV